MSGDTKTLDLPADVLVSPIVSLSSDLLKASLCRFFLSPNDPLFLVCLVGFFYITEIINVVTVVWSCLKFSSDLIDETSVVRSFYLMFHLFFFLFYLIPSELFLNMFGTFLIN